MFQKIFKNLHFFENLQMSFHKTCLKNLQKYFFENFIFEVSKKFEMSFTEKCLKKFQKYFFENS